MCMRAQGYEIKTGTGEHWWLSVLKALTGGGDGKTGDDDVQWL